MTSGGDSLTLADLNTEAANSQALDLRQQLGIQSLGVANTINQAVLQLLR
jgi:flagellin-like hook-associated protein FlgL